MIAKKKWSELSSRDRRLLAVLGVVEVVLLAATLFAGASPFPLRPQ